MFVMVCEELFGLASCLNTAPVPVVPPLLCIPQYMEPCSHEQLLRCLEDGRLRVFRFATMKMVGPMEIFFHDS